MTDVSRGLVERLRALLDSREEGDQWFDIERETLDEIVAALEASIAREERAAKYLRHTLTCSRPRKPECDCGLDAFLAEIQARAALGESK